MCKNTRERKSSVTRALCTTVFVLAVLKQSRGGRPATSKTMSCYHELGKARRHDFWVLLLGLFSSSLAWKMKPFPSSLSCRRRRRHRHGNLLQQQHKRPLIAGQKSLRQPSAAGRHIKPHPHIQCVIIKHRNVASEREKRGSWITAMESRGEYLTLDRVAHSGTVGHSRQLPVHAFMHISTYIFMPP